MKKKNNIEVKNKRKNLPALAPKKSLNSLSIVFVVAGGEVAIGVGRELVAPRPQGSDILTERLVSLVAIVWLFPLHGLACGVGAIELSHGSFDTVVAEVCPFDSNVHGSSMREKKAIIIFCLFKENWSKQRNEKKIIMI